MARAQGARAQMAVAFESTFGTAPGSGFKRMPFATSDLDSVQELLPNELLGFGRDPLAPDLDSVDVNGTLAVPVTLNDFGVWLKATFGASATTGSAGEYTHVFSSGGWTLPSLSIETAWPEVPRFAMAKGVKVNQMAINLTRKGHIQADLGLIGRDSTPATTTQVGTLGTDYELARFLQRHGAISIDGSPVGEVVSATLTYMNNLDAGEVIGDGGKIAWLDPTMANLQFEMAVRFASDDLFEAATSGEAIELTYALTRAEDESLTFAIPRLFLPKPKAVTNGPRGVQATFTGIAAKQADGDPMFTATLVNAVSAY